MNLLETFKLAVNEIEAREMTYALAGGLAASLYRAQPRTTTDLDFVVSMKSSGEEKMNSFFKALGLEPRIARKANLEGGPKFAIKNEATPICIYVGRDSKDANRVGVDFLVEGIPWFQPALTRAQTNRINFGFGVIPCLTCEDIVLAKLYSLGNDARRTDDLSDLRSIFEAQKNIDFTYISNQMTKLKLRLPLSFAKEAPPTLKRASRLVQKHFRKSHTLK